jgi:caa(3)-type oxidase subunit IV
MPQQKEAAVIGMWVFLLTEILFFGGLFLVYMVYRIWYFDAFAEASRTLSLFWGGLNTAVLIGSSLTMAMAVRGAQTNKRQATVNWLILTMVLGTVFLGVKVIEYADKFEHHHVPGPNFVWAHEAAPGAEGATAEAAPSGHRQLSLPPDQLQHDADFFSLYDDGLHALHDHRHRPDERDHLDGVEGQVRRALLHARGAERPLLALRRHRLDFPVPAALPRREAPVMSDHVSPVSLYITIFASLMVLTAVTVGAAFINLGQFNFLVAMLVAGFKASLVVWYFMHMKHQSHLTKLALAVGMLFLVIVLGETMIDYASKDFSPMPPRVNPDSEFQRP